MPADLSRWVLQRYNPDNESIVVPGRGEIHVTTESVHQTLGLRNSGEEVFYGWDAEAISFSNNKYGFESGMAPQITTFYNLIKGMNGRADDDFMRKWLIVVVSCFICPTTSLNVSPRCYPIVADLERVKRLNLCSFTAKQIRSSFCKTTRKKAVNCCVHHMVVSTFWVFFPFFGFSFISLDKTERHCHSQHGKCKKNTGVVCGFIGC
ncbi:hypothetical protein ZWY2020_028462 [Hordeum vulgare]|nr:hypothetical protein ZWY2020_028462 [Hordeum vulgare]